MLTVNPALVKPAVTKDPKAVTVNATEAASFTAEASGNPAPSVQWEVSEGGGAFKEVPGATSDTYTILSTSTAESGDRYEAVFTNSQGKATSNPATLTVNPALVKPVVSKQPGAKTVNATEAASFTAEASGNPAPTVQWEVSESGGPFEPVVGATSDTYTILSTSTAESGDRYEAVFTNSQGKATSNPATLTVNPPPTITSIVPSSGPTAGGTSVTIKGTGFGTTTATNTVTIGGAAASVTAASAISLTVTTPARSAGAASVVVTNTTDGLSVTDAGGYTYIPPPTVTLNQPLSPSNKTTPSFTGNATDTTTVTVKIYAGATAKGSVVSMATATGTGGSWTSGNASPALENGQYTATATQAGLVGNPAGVSPPVTFEVNTEPPKVTLNQPSTPSRDTTPTFSGAASEDTEVIVRVYEGSKPEGAEKAKVTTTAAGGSWSVGATLPSGDHTYTALATEVSGLENSPGKSIAVTFVVNTEPPVVTLAGPPTPSRNTTPSFTGTASENTGVEVHVLLEGTEVASATTTASGGKWSTETLSKALPTGKHSFTAYAMERSGLGNAEGTSNTVTFEVDTLPPEVTLESPPLVSGNRTPSFSGTASETAPVTVKVFKAAKPEGTPVATLVTQLNAGHYTTTVSSSLASGEYTAIASEPSSIENPTGYSVPVTFEIEANAPTVELTKPPHESNDTTPTFSGTVTAPESEKEKVTVYVHEGSSYQGPIVRTVEASVVKGEWTSGAVSPELPAGMHTYTAVATTPSAIGNGVGKSAPETFVVNTEAPKVTLAQPAARSKNTKPTFSGTASEDTEVIVRVYEGSKPEGAEVAKVTTTAAGGSWSVGATLPSGDHTYTALATEVSGLGNSPGKSSAVTFEVNTEPPVVKLLKGPQERSSDRKPSFSGTASDSTPATVDIYQGANPEGPIVASIEARVEGGEWFADQTEPLEFGEYTAVARQPSSIGNEGGKSAPARFVVAQIPPVVLTEAPSAIAETHAALYASVNPAGGPVSACNFEVGATPSYGREVGCGFVSGASAFPPAGVGFVPVFIRIYGLRPSTTYHYRVVAAGEGGTGTGADQTFTTLPQEGSRAPSAPPPSAPAHGAGTGVAAVFAEQVIPTGRAARIGALLKNGLFKQRFKAPEAGTAVVKWYYLAPGARLAGAQHAKKAAPTPVLVASGSVTFHAAGTASVKLRLTPAGRRLLRHSRRVRLTATCAFTPVGGATITASGTFQLSR